MKLQVSEIDPIFNDTGEIKLTVSLPMEQIVNVQVKGRGRGETNKTATITFSLVIKKEDMTRYVYNVDEEGWLFVRTSDRKRIKLPLLLKLNLEEKRDGREYFEIAEGPLKGVKASVAIDSDGNSFLTEFVQYQPGISLVFDRSLKVLSVPGFGNISAVTAENPIPPGEYQIEVPDYAHKSQIEYFEQAKLFRIWFLLEKKHERYLHTGHKSTGCITVDDLSKWDDICRLLLISRVKEGIVGTLTVK